MSGTLLVIAVIATAVMVALRTWPAHGNSLEEHGLGLAALRRAVARSKDAHPAR